MEIHLITSPRDGAREAESAAWSVHTLPPYQLSNDRVFWHVYSSVESFNTFCWSLLIAFSIDLIRQSQQKDQSHLFHIVHY